MTGHDPRCPESQPDPGDTARQSGCLCLLIAAVRVDMCEQIAAVFAERRTELRAVGERNGLGEHPVHRAQLRELDRAYELALEFAREAGGLP